MLISSMQLRCLSHKSTVCRAPFTAFVSCTDARWHKPSLQTERLLAARRCGGMCRRPALPAWQAHDQGRAYTPLALTALIPATRQPPPAPSCSRSSQSSAASAVECPARSDGRVKRCPSGPMRAQ